LHLTAHSAIADYESGHRIPPADVLRGYERFFNVPPGTLAQLRKQAIAERAEREEARRPSPSVGDAGQATERGIRIVPRQLPVTPAVFVGREDVLAQLGYLLAPGSAQQVVAVSGMAGVGKTALALRWAQQNEALFPDGTLYINLLGYDPTGRPVAPTTALDGMLRALGLANERIPYEAAERAALFRSLTAAMSVLIVLDNARNAEQVRELLPGVGAARAIVTSRSRLAGLVVREGAIPLFLDVLAPQAAVALLRLVTGLAIPDQEASELAQLCGRLPLALRVAGERIAMDPAAGPLRTVAELSDPRARLEALDINQDDVTAVRRVLAWSYEASSPLAQRVLRQLGHVSLADIDVPAAAALTGLELPTARPLLEHLADGHLIIASGGRYSMHDLVRCFARETSAQQDGSEDTEASVTRLTEWYLHSACNARQALAPQLPPLPARVPAPQITPALFASAQEALAWCETERGNLVTATQAAYEHGLYIVAWQLPTALYGFFELRKYWNDWIDTHTIALQASQRLGDGEAEGRIWCNLGNAYRPLYQFDTAIDCYRNALALFLTVGYQQGEAKVLGNLGTTLREMGRLTDSIEHHQQALAHFSAIGDRYGRALTLTNLGEAYCATGQAVKAMTAHEEALELFRRADDPEGQARALSNMGKTLAAADQHERALQYHDQAAQLFKSAGNRLDHAYALADVMAAYFALGELAQAHAHGRRAAGLLAELGHDAATGQVLTDLAVIYELAGDHSRAEACRRDAALAQSRVTPAQQEAARRVATALRAPGRTGVSL
jgi:tetratricopeptide (TPR) repeat protein